MISTPASPESKDVLDLAKQLFESNERRNFESQWDIQAQYLLPMQSGIFFGNNLSEGDKKTDNLLYSEGVLSNQDLAASLHSTLTNPATEWAKLKFTDDELNQDEESKIWLEDSVKRMHKAFNDSNFDTEMASNYQIFTALGSMSLQHESLPLKPDGTFGGFFFKGWHLANLAVMENQWGVVDTIVRKFKYTAKQAKERWESLPDKIRETEDVNVKFDFIQVIRPRKSFKGDPTALILPVDEMPFENIVVEKDSGMVVERGGYMEFPNHFTRWGVLAGETYGRGPGHHVIPDVRTLNKLIEMGMTSLAIGIAPPILSTRRNIVSNLRLKPNGLTIVRNLNDITQMQSQARGDFYQFTRDDYVQSIRRGFFLDKLLLPPREDVGEMTAFEIARRIEQMQRVLGPTFGRLNKEALQPLVLRSFKMMLRQNAFKELPPMVREFGINVDISFINQLARSQRVEELNAINQYVQTAGFLAQFNPDAADTFDVDKAMAVVGEVVGLPEAISPSDNEKKAKRDARNEQQQALAEAQINQTNADAQSKLR